MVRLFFFHDASFFLGCEVCVYPLKNKSFSHVPICRGWTLPNWPNFIHSLTPRRSLNSQQCVLTQAAFGELFLKAGDTWFPNVNCSSRSRGSFLCKDLSKCFTTLLSAWWWGFDAEGRTGLVARRGTRVGAVEGNSFPPQQKTALVKTRLSLVFGYCFASAAELSDAPLLWSRPFSPASAPSQFHFQQSEAEPSVKLRATLRRNVC